MAFAPVSDPEKKRLTEEVARRKAELDKATGFLPGRTDKVIRNALIIGGALAASYLVFRAVSKYRKKNKSVSDDPLKPAPIPSASSGASDFLAQIGNRVAQEATLFLLRLAKEKLTEWIESKQSRDGNS